MSAIQYGSGQVITNTTASTEAIIPVIRHDLTTEYWKDDLPEGAWMATIQSVYEYYKATQHNHFLEGKYSYEITSTGYQYLFYQGNPVYWDQKVNPHQFTHEDLTYEPHLAINLVDFEKKQDPPLERGASSPDEQQQEVKTPPAEEYSNPIETSIVKLEEIKTPLTPIQQLPAIVTSTIPTTSSNMGSQAGATVNTTTSKGPTIVAPTTFTGDRRKTERFLFECNLVITARPDDYKTDAAKIAFVLSYMKEGTASAWAMNYHEQQAKATTKHSYANFINAVKKAFTEIDAGRSDRHRLINLRQGTYSADSYIALFNSYKDKTKFNEEALIEYFKNGLRNDLVRRIEDMETIPTTLELWQTKAAQFDMTRSMSRNYNNQWSSNWRNNNCHGSRENPIQIDVVQNVFTKLTDRERDELRRKGACFYCRETGHISRNCPNRKKRSFQARRTTTPSNITVQTIMEQLPEDDYSDLLMAIHERNSSNNNTEQDF